MYHKCGIFIIKEYTMEIKYRVINTTIKPVVRNSKGDDVRKALDKIGHPVKFKEGKNDVVLHAGQMRLVTDLNPGVMALQRGGYVKIEKVEDMNEALKDHVYRPENVVETPHEELKVRAVEMGLDDYKQQEGSEHEGAVNPDGNPNFLVKVKRNKKNATVSDSGQKDGESTKVSPSVP